MKWPDNKQFAFTIVDDTDNSTVDNIQPVYELLEKLNLKTTKTVWVYPSRDRFKGECLSDSHYSAFVLDLQSKGFEIASHGVGSGSFSSTEIATGFDIYRKILGKYPAMHINHAQNPDNLYWGFRAGSKLLQKYARWRIPNEKYYGDVKESGHFWGDFAKKNIKYMRSRVFREINTLKMDPRMPYRDRDKEACSNFWFSSSDGSNVKNFSRLLTKQNVDSLEKEGGLCIVYTHFASGFVSNGVLDADFREKMTYLASRNGWFVPAGKILDYLLEQRTNEYESERYFMRMDLREFIKAKWRRLTKKT